MQRLAVTATLDGGIEWVEGHPCSTSFASWVIEVRVLKGDTINANESNEFSAYTLRQGSNIGCSNRRCFIQEWHEAKFRARVFCFFLLTVTRGRAEERCSEQHQGTDD